jgi:apolipoprotein N-acyltransferase
VKSFRVNPLIYGRYPVSIFAGLLLACAFPKIGIAGFAWVAPGLMAAASLGKNGADRFRIGYVGGFVFYLATLYWLLLIPYRWHSFPLAPAAGWLALSAYMAIYPATWVWFVGHLKARSTGEEKFVLAETWLERTWWALAGAILWVGLEMVISRLFSGFPWNLLGTCQYQLLPIIQVSSFTGVYGVSFLIIWFSLCLLSAGLTLLRKPARQSLWIGEILFPIVVLAIIFNLGFHEIRRGSNEGRSVKVIFVQPSIPQTLIWDASRDDERFRDLVALSSQAATNHADLMLWPEAAVPKLLRYDKQTFEALTGLARSNHIWMIVGSDDAEPREHATKENEADYFNSSFLINPEGKLVGRYRKRALVIFGEYIPLERWLPIVKWFTPIQGGFTPGDRAVPFELPDVPIKTSVLICFEDVFPHLAREYVDGDTDFLVNITNNGWFGEGAAQWQHAVTALFRAVENRRPLLRCSNNGLTCWVDAHGRLRQMFRDDDKGVYGRGFMTAEIPLPEPGIFRARTFYNRHGDVFGWSCFAISVLMCARRLIRRKSQRLPAA